MKKRLFLMLGLTSVGFHNTAFAQPAPSSSTSFVCDATLTGSQQAVRLFMEGTVLMTSTPPQPAAAAERYLCAYRIGHNQELLFNAGVAYETAGRDEDALSCYQQFRTILMSANHPLNANEQASLTETERRIRNLHEQMVTHSPPPPPPPPVPIRVPPPVTRPRIVMTRPLSVPSLVCFGVGGTALTFGLVSLGYALHSNGIVNDAAGQPLTSYVEQHGRAADVAMISFGISTAVGAAAIGTGLYLHLTRPVRHREVWDTPPRVLGVTSGPGAVGLSLFGQF